MTDTDELIKRLDGYNTPDRTIDDQRQIAVDIQDAKFALESLQRKVAELESQLAARGEPVYWQWRKISEHWSSEFIFSFEVKATDEDSEVRKLFTAPAVPAGSITISKELRDFLMGAESFDGHWFGDSVDGRRFWWRKYLEAAAPKGE